MKQQLVCSILAALALTGAGCRAPLAALRHRAEMQTVLGQFTLAYSDADIDMEQRLLEAIAHATPKTSRWGELGEPVRIHVLPDHDQLEKAINRDGYPWLKAWARYDEILLQSPRTWALFGARQHEINELLAHELTHCLMYQRSATRTGWARKEIPLWFREGMASVTAEQGYRWPTLEDLALFYERNEGLDPVSDADALYQEKSGIVYGAAHHAFAFLLGRYGDAPIRAVLAQMRQGATFRPAFEEGIGIPVETFLREFRRYVRWRGFRR